MAGSVTQAMNMVVAARRLREAAVWVAEAHKIILVLPELCLFQNTVLILQVTVLYRAGEGGCLGR